MTVFNVTIEDAGQLSGITAARNAYNSALPVAEGQNVADHDDYIATDADYVQFVMEGAAASYAAKYGA